MSILIPSHRIAGFVMAPRLFSGEQQGALGGPDLPIPRIGDRWSANIETAQLRQNAAGAAMVGALNQASGPDGGRIAIVQPEHPALPAMAPVVDGAGQLGSSILLRGVPAATVFGAWRHFSILHLGVHYVHQSTVAATADANGRLRLSIWPMLRFETLDGERAYLADPMIEGSVTGFQGGKRVRNRFDPLSFTISERA